MEKNICPVPFNQRPLNEFNSITNSWIISWPLLRKNEFYLRLFFSWVLILPINLLISYGSDYLRNNIFYFTITSFTGSLIGPLILLLRQYLSWKYIFNRLNSVNIEYEESGWYDGQVWEKPIDWRSKDLLIAQHQVKPILNHLGKVLILILSVILSISISVIINLNYK
tara:strand:- start:55 stop:558 length:504 start_codon:yes stop_codon:yes gene_type:complete